MQGYEPYVVVSRKYVPWADERFAGYHKNKVIYLMHLAHQGLRFMVHPRAFVVHTPHPKGRSFELNRLSHRWLGLDVVFDEVKAQMEATAYVPAARYACGAHLIGPHLSRDNISSSLAAGASASAQALAGVWA